jgi:hypothetical protein
MAAVSHPGPVAGTIHHAVSAQTVTAARRAALFASWLERSDAPTAAMAAEAITATARRFGIDGCVSRMAQEFGDHPDAAAERMRWICQLTAEVPAWLQIPAHGGRASGKAGNETEAGSGHDSTATRLGRGPGTTAQHSGERTRHEPDV